MMVRTLPFIVASAVTCLLSYVPSASGHGMLWEPTNRGSLWRKGVAGAPTQYTDNQQVAGGPGVVRASRPYRHGVCGDPWASPRPRSQETGGTYGKGLISACYTVASQVTFEVIITAHHKGWFDFGICKLKRGQVEEESCFKPLVQTTGNQLWALPDTGPAIYSMKYKLPRGLTCYGEDHCIIRWHYLTGNSCPQQSANDCLYNSAQAEEFWSCSDVQIGPNLSACQSSVARTASEDKWRLPITNRNDALNPWVPSDNWKPEDNPNQDVTLPPSSLDPPQSAPPGSDPRPLTCGICSNCLRRWSSGEGCYAGWSRAQCVGQEYTWCGGISATPITPIPDTPRPDTTTTTTAAPSNGGNKPAICGVCESCLRYWDNGQFLQTACYAGWSKQVCERAGSGYQWCKST